MVIGLSFDVYRSIRHWFGWGPILTFGGDIIFSLGALFLFLYFLEKANGLAFRFYVFWGSLLGLLFYLRLFSRTVTRLLLKSFDLVLAILRFDLHLLEFPYRGLRLLMRPFYAVLRWASMLMFRLSEAVLVYPAKRLSLDARDWWDRHFPPRTNG